jgi:glycosyltransferase involved in cell wall biosynthesis
MRSRRSNPASRPTIALVTQGITSGGGVPTVASWLAEGLRTWGYSVDIHDLATSRRDPNSRQIARPATWMRGTLRGPYDRARDVQPWGANAVELEPMRYLPRPELSAALGNYDLIQVVAGAPALACAVLPAGPPVFLQVATRLRWERRQRHSSGAFGTRMWGETMTSFASRLEHRALQRVDGVFVENERMLSDVREAGQDNVWLAPPGVDTELFRPAASGWLRSGYLLSVCRLAEPRKRLDRLINAYRNLVVADPEAPPLILAGHGELPGSLRALIDRHGLGARVTIRSDVPAKELPSLYQGASIYLQTSDEEGLGMSVLEAMACGVPVVATDTAGARECVAEGVTGYLVDRTDENALAQLVSNRALAILNISGHRIAATARHHTLEHFDGRAALGKFVDLYEKILLEWAHP